MDKEVYCLELTRAERDFLLAVFEAGMAAIGVATLVAKLRAVRVEEPQAPAVAEEPAV